MVKKPSFVSNLKEKVSAEPLSFLAAVLAVISASISLSDFRAKSRYDYKVIERVSGAAQQLTGIGSATS